MNINYGEFESVKEYAFHLPETRVKALEMELLMLTIWTVTTVTVSDIGNVRRAQMELLNRNCPLRTSFNSTQLTLGLTNGQNGTVF